MKYSSSFAAIFFLALLIIWRRTRLSPHPYPPGPKGLPLIGNVRDLPLRCSWLAFAKWSRQFASDVIYLNFLGTHVLVVNSADAASELFGKRSAIYSDRPRLPMLTEVANWNFTFGFFRYGDQWRTHRRLFHKYLNNKNTTNFEPQASRAAHGLLYRLMHEPEAFMDHTRVFSGALILSAAYGTDVQSLQDPIMATIERGLEILTIIGGNPGDFLVNFFPLLIHVPAWVPGAGFKRKARDWRKLVQATADSPFQHVKNEIADGVGTPSIASLALEELGCNGDPDRADVIRGVSAGAYAAGGHTTAYTVSSFFLAMVLHQEVVRKAQEELDRVVGPDRLPDFADEPFLPYVCAVLYEVLRWNPVTPLAVAHRLTIDDVYKGQCMPAGSIVLGNSWAILHDEKTYGPHPETFNPERFLKDSQLDPNIRSPEDAAFGFGRRVCPGRHYALSSIFLTFACILSAFNVGKAEDEDGNPITPSGEYVSDLLWHPVPFKCSIRPRSPQASSLIMEAYTSHYP